MNPEEEIIKHFPVKYQDKWLEYARSDRKESDINLIARVQVLGLMYRLMPDKEKL